MAVREPVKSPRPHRKEPLSRTDRQTSARGMSKAEGGVSQRGEQTAPTPDGSPVHGQVHGQVLR